MKYKIGDKIKKIDYDKIHSDIHNNIKFLQRKLNDGEKVYIDSFSDIPRTKFKKSFPNNKIVYNVAEADVMLLPQKVRYISTPYNLFGGNWHSREIGEIDTITKLKHINEVIKCHEAVMSGKPIIKDTDILYKGEIPRKMDNSEYDRIAGMLTSPDKEMLNLGMEILLGFDSQINEKEYVLLLAQIKSPYLIKKSRTYKSIVKTLKQKYVNLR